LALFFVGIYTQWSPKGWAVVLWCVVSPLLTYFLKLSDAVGVWSQGRDVAKFNVLESFWYSLSPANKPWFGDYVIGFESLIINAAIVVLGLGLIHGIQRGKK
jgi:hypothetical protein